MYLDYAEFKRKEIGEIHKKTRPCWKYALGCGSYDIDIKLSEDLFDILAREYPYSGVDYFMDKVKERELTTKYPVPYSSYDFKTKMYIRYKVLYYKLYSIMPQIEIVIKAGFEGIIIDNLSGYNVPNMQLLKRNFKPGKNIKEICSLPPYTWDHFRGLKTLREWNETRVLVNKYLDTREKFEKYLSLNVRYGMLDMAGKIKRVLNTGYYDPEKLFCYLDRLDVYQAISPDEGIMIILDYINMCKMCEAEPDILTNNLKKDHDLMAKTCMIMSQTKYNDAFAKKSKDNKKYEYSYGGYNIVSPSETGDMLEAAKQQRNCLAAYIKPVAEGESIILFIEENSKPGIYIAAIELDPSSLNIRQKYMKYNQPITNKNILKMLDAYSNHIINDIKGVA